MGGGGWSAEGGLSVPTQAPTHSPPQQKSQKGLKLEADFRYQTFCGLRITRVLADATGHQSVHKGEHRMHELHCREGHSCRSIGGRLANKRCKRGGWGVVRAIRPGHCLVAPPAPTSPLVVQRRLHRIRPQDVCANKGIPAATSAVVEQHRWGPTGLWEEAHLRAPTSHTASPTKAPQLEQLITRRGRPETHSTTGPISHQNQANVIHNADLSICRDRSPAARGAAVVGGCPAQMQSESIGHRHQRKHGRGHRRRHRNSHRHRRSAPKLGEAGGSWGAEVMQSVIWAAPTACPPTT